MQRKCTNYGFPIEEPRLWRAVTGNLDDRWKDIISKFGEDRRAWTWDTVSSILHQEDMLRRQFVSGSRRILFPPLASEKQGKAYAVTFPTPKLTPIKTS